MLLHLLLFLPLAAHGEDAEAGGEHAESEFHAPPKQNTQEDFMHEEPGQIPVTLRRSVVLLGQGERAVTFLLTYRRGTFSGDEEFREVAFETLLEAGLTDWLTGFLRIPFSHRAVKGSREVYGDEDEDDSPVRDSVSRERDGLGDIEVGIKGLVSPERKFLPEMDASVSITMPTGEGDQYRDVEVNPDIGAGHWAATASLSLIKSFSPFRVFGSVYHTRYLASRSHGQQVGPGASSGLDIGATCELTSNLSIGLQHTREHQEKTRIDSHPLEGSSSNTSSLRASISFGLSKGWYAEPFIALGLNSQTNDIETGLSLSRPF